MTEKLNQDVFELVAIWMHRVESIWYTVGDSGEREPREGNRFWTFEDLLKQRYCGSVDFGLPQESYLAELEVMRANSPIIQPYMTNRIVPVLLDCSRNDIFFGKYDQPIRSPNGKRVDWKQCREAWGRYDHEDQKSPGSIAKQRRHYLNRYSEEGQRQDRSGRFQLQEFNSAVQLRLEEEIKRLKVEGV